MKKIIVTIIFIFMMPFANAYETNSTENNSKKCDSGDDSACAMLASIYKSHPKLKDLEKYKATTDKLLKLRKSACENGNADKCYFLGEMYDPDDFTSNRLVKEDTKTSNTFYSKFIKIATKSCDKDDFEACYRLSTLYKDGKGVKQDSKKANEYMNKACDKGYAMTCNYLGQRYERHDPKKSLAYYKKGCALKSADSCSTIGYMYETGKGLEQDNQKAAAAYKIACDFGYQNICKKYEALK